MGEQRTAGLCERRQQGRGQGRRGEIRSLACSAPCTRLPRPASRRTVVIGIDRVAVLPVLSRRRARRSASASQTPRVIRSVRPRTPAERAQGARLIPSRAIQDADGHHEETKIKNVQRIQLGKYMIDTWYYSPFPEVCMQTLKPAPVPAPLRICHAHMRDAAATGVLCDQHQIASPRLCRRSTTAIAHSTFASSRSSASSRHPPSTAHARATSCPRTDALHNRHRTKRGRPGPDPRPRDMTCAGSSALRLG